jgi:Ca-activated chloride channel family protein
MRLADPWFLAALLILPFWLSSYLKNPPWSKINVRFSNTGTITRLKSYRSPLGAHASFVLRFVAVLLLIVALARPQTGYRETQIISKGIDIMLTLDLSSSMSANDLKPNRLNAAKKVLAEFIRGRTNDRIGLVVFASEGYTQCPLTLDYPVLLNFLDSSSIGLIDDGTAIGMAIATAANRFKDSPAKSKIVVLLTDGMNNKGAIDPLTAARMARAVDVKVYTIGVGREGTFTQTVNDPRFGKRKIVVQTQIDEDLLRKIARITGGSYFRAEDEEALLSIYKNIDKMEKTDIKTRMYARHTDFFMWFLYPALALIFMELALPVTRWRSVP